MCWKNYSPYSYNNNSNGSNKIACLGSQLPLPNNIMEVVFHSKMYDPDEHVIIALNFFVYVMGFTGWCLSSKNKFTLWR